jgi:hypothetical protein
MEAAKAGKLRREKVSIWFGEEIEQRRNREPIQYLAGLIDETTSSTANLASSFAAALAPAGVTLTPLERGEVFAAWYRTLNPSPASHRVNSVVPTSEVFSLTDTCWLSELRGLGDRAFRLDGEYFSTRTLRSLPTTTFPGLLDHLLTLPIPNLRIILRARRLPKKKVVERLKAELERLQRHLARRADPIVQVTRDQLWAKLDQLARDQMVPMEFELITLTHASSPEELRRHDDLIKSAAGRMNGATLFEASLAATARNLFLKSLPGWLWSDDPGFVHYGESTYVADLLPMSSGFEAHLEGAEALFAGPYQNLIGVRNFVGEGHAEMPQNMVIVGVIGSGKSFFLCHLLTETAPYFDYTAILEEGLSHAAFTKALGGTPIVISPDAPWTINPFHSAGVPRSSFQLSAIAGTICLMMGIRDDELGREKAAKLAGHIGQLCEDFTADWLRRQPEAERLRIGRLALVADQLSRENFLSLTEAFAQVRNQSTTKEIRLRLDSATDAEVRAYMTKNRKTVHDVAYAFLPEYPILSSLRDHLEMEGVRDEECRRLAGLLGPWCAGGLYGKNFDGPNTVVIDGSTTHFELGRIPESAKVLKAVVGFVFLTILLRQHLLKLSRRARKRVIIEEISRFLLIPGGENLLLELIEQLRKFQVQVVVVLQQISQLVSERLRTAILGNSRMFFTFSLGDPTDLDRLAEHVPVSDAAKAMILRYARPDQLRGQIYSECCYLHRTASEPYCGTIRFVPIDLEQSDQTHESSQTNPVLHPVR